MGQHLGHELLVQGGGGRLLSAVGHGQDLTGVKDAGLGVGGVARPVGGGQHPAARPGRRQPPVHGDMSLHVQQQGRLGRPVRPLEVEGDAFAGPLRRQGKGQDVYPFGVLAAQVEPCRPGDKVGAARELPGCDLNVHHRIFLSRGAAAPLFGTIVPARQRRGQRVLLGPKPGWKSYTFLGAGGPREEKIASKTKNKC